VNSTREKFGCGNGDEDQYQDQAERKMETKYSRSEKGMGGNHAPHHRTKQREEGESESTSACRFRSPFFIPVVVSFLHFI